jgi:hypothetical protein
VAGRARTGRAAAGWAFLSVTEAGRHEPRPTGRLRPGLVVASVQEQDGGRRAGARSRSCGREVEAVGGRLRLERLCRARAAVGWAGPGGVGHRGEPGVRAGR